jgi:hypothetical protein
MKKPLKHLIAKVPRSVAKVGMTIGIDLGDVWSHYRTLNEDGEVVNRGRFRTTPSGVEKWLTDLPRARVAMETGTHSIWVSEQVRELGHEVIVSNGRELRAISHSDRKGDTVDADHVQRMGGRLPSSARRMVDDSEGKAIGSGDYHMTPVREGPVSVPIHRLQFFDPVLRGLPRFLQAISPEYCLVKCG